MIIIIVTAVETSNLTIVLFLAGNFLVRRLGTRKLIASRSSYIGALSGMLLSFRINNNLVIT
jgi:uncharacterized protein YqgC (DUF456 family)